MFKIIFKVLKVYFLEEKNHFEETKSCIIKIEEKILFLVQQEISNINDNRQLTVFIFLEICFIIYVYRVGIFGRFFRPSREL